MNIKPRAILVKAKEFIKTHKKLLIAISLLIIVILVTIPLSIMQNGRLKTYINIDKVPEYKVGIVFGAGIKDDNTPSDMLQDRLDTAAELYQKGKIKLILVSGDNRTEKYSEPDVMHDYLVNTYDIPSENIYRDFAGLRTYDTCARAKLLWHVNKAILITQGYHLYRAIYTCENLGIESTGYSATKHIYVYQANYESRELLALYKSFLDSKLFPPTFIGGKEETDLSE